MNNGELVTVDEIAAAMGTPAATVVRELSELGIPTSKDWAGRTAVPPWRAKALVSGSARHERDVVRAHARSVEERTRSDREMLRAALLAADAAEDRLVAAEPGEEHRTYHRDKWMRGEEQLQVVRTERCLQVRVQAAQAAVAGLSRGQIREVVGALPVAVADRELGVG